MKKYFVITLFVLISVSCIKKERIDDSRVAYCNFSEPDTFNIAINCEYLTEEQFNQASCDTTIMYKLDENTSLQFYNALRRLKYELAAAWHNNELGMAMYAKQDSIYSREEFFLYGKLNLQPDVQSFILFIFDKEAKRKGFPPYHNFLLVNIKDNQLCSIVKLVLPEIRVIDSSLVWATCVNNKIFTQISSSGEYFLFDYFGERFTKKIIREFATYKVNENGFIEFTKDKFYKYESK